MPSRFRFRRPLGLLFLCVSLLLIAALPAASQDDGGGDGEPPHVPAPPREWATLDVTVEEQDSLTTHLGRQTILPITIANNGNIAAAGVVAVVEGGNFLVGTPVKVGDIQPKEIVNLELPFDVLGRSAFALPFSVRVSAENVAYPTVVAVERDFAGLTTDDYLGVSLDADLWLEQTYDHYDGGFARPQPLLWFESREKANDALLTIDLEPLLTGEPPKDLVLSVLYYPDEKELPEPVEAKYDPEQLSLTFAPAGEGRYLVEWSRPLPKEDAAEGTGLEELNGAAAVTATEPELPQGWTPSYHAPLVSEFNGSVSLSYPILTPPGAAGLQPNLGLSYSSGNGNGMIGRLQADEVGFGWNNTALIDVTQALDACQENVCEGLGGDIDGNPNTNDPYNQYTLSYNGAGYELVHTSGKASNGNPGRYYAQGHAGLYVELCKAPFSAYCTFSFDDDDDDGPFDTQSDVFWRIKSADNTTYRLGFTTESEQEIRYPGLAGGVTNKALRWRVDTVIDRFGNKMNYSYVEDYYTGWVHPEYFHVPASYLTQIDYDEAYTVIFSYQPLPTYAYYEQGYGHVVSWHTRYLIEIGVNAGGQPLRRYVLTHNFQRYGTDNDTDHLPLEIPPAIPNQSTWCADMDWVIDFRDPGNPNDNIKYTPDSLPILRAIQEFGRNGASKSGLADAEFTYSFLGTGEYDNYPTYARYCFPYMTSMETLYGPVSATTPTTAIAWRAAQQEYQLPGSLPSTSVLGRYVNLVERETTYSGFANDAPTQDIYFRYTTANMQGDEDTFQGFNTVERCRAAACAGSWTEKVTLTFLTYPYYHDDAPLTGKPSFRYVYKAGGTLVAQTENTWAVLGPTTTRTAVLDKQIQRDYRGGAISSRTDYEYDAYGNQTEVREYGERTADPPWRTLERKYTVNTNTPGDKWLVNLAWRETLWDGPPNETQASKIVRRTRFRYDGAACGSPSDTPTNGLLTAEDAYVPGFGVSCGGTDYNTTTYFYGGAGGGAGASWQLTGVNDPAIRWRTFYWANATQMTQTRTVIGDTFYTYDAIFRWQAREVTQPNGAKTRYTYDIHGRLDQVFAPDAANGAVGSVAMDYDYLDLENPFYVDEKNMAISGGAPPTTRTFYDAVGRPLQTRRFNVSEDFVTAVTDTEYDGFGRVSCASAPLSTSAQGFNSAIDCDAQPKVLYTYDVLGEQLTATGIDNVVTSTVVAGRQRQVTNGEGHTTTYESDELGRLKKVTQPVVNGSAPVMTYTYDLADNLLTATGPNNAVTTLSYDKLGRKLTMNDPDMGIWNYAYDGSGNLVRQTDAKSQRLCFYYDEANRLSSKRHDGAGTGACPGTPAGTLLAGYTYYAGGAGKGLLASVAKGSGVGELADTLVYDYRGRVTSHTRVIGGASGRGYTLNTGYDLADRPAQLTYPAIAGDANREQVYIGYDGEFPQSSYGTTVYGTTVMVTGMIHNYRGQLTKIDRPGSALDTDLMYYNQTENYRLDEIWHGAAFDSVPDFLYSEYDNLGNVKKVEMRQSPLETQTFTYDAIGRLKTAQGTVAASYNYVYTYGPGGNLATRENVTNGETRSYTYGTPAEHHAHAVIDISGDGMTATFTYDANGNMLIRNISGAIYNQTFDAENRLTKVTRGSLVAEFYYDADGNRILTVYVSGASQVKVYTPFPEFEESVPPAGATTQRRSYYLAGQLIAVRVRTGTTGNGALYFAYADHLGNVSAWTDASGGFVSGSLARYEPYGGYRTKPAASVNPDISDRGFTGHKQNNTGAYNLGLIYMNARYYLPEIGRFISADTIVPEPQNPQTYNRYSYALNSPTNYTDPTGHCTNNYEAGSQDLDTCISAWSAVMNYFYKVAYGSGGNGHFPSQLTTEWLMNADIDTLENLMDVFGIDYGYTYALPSSRSSSSGQPGWHNRIAHLSDGICQYWQNCYEPVVTGEEMKPDAIAGGVSGSAAGIAYGIIGGEVVYNFNTEELSLFSYHGQGAGIALEADKSGHGALIWNLDKNADYEGVSPTLAVDLGLGIHGQVALFWEEGTIPFTGETWGIAFGSGPGLGFALTGSFSHYTCQSGCW